MRNARIPEVRCLLEDYSLKLLQQAGTNCPLLQLPAIKLMPPIAKVAHRQADSALSGFREQVNMPIPSHLAATAKVVS